MAGAAHPQAMAPSRAGPTRTAPPQTPGSWPSHPRMRVYTLFGVTGFIYLIMGFLCLRFVWALGAGPERWAVVVATLSNPIYIAFHLLALASVIFVGIRFFRLFPKAQPAHIGPLKPPPGPVLHAMLYAAWAGVALGFAAVLTGAIL